MTSIHYEICKRLKDQSDAVGEERGDWLPLQKRRAVFAIKVVKTTFFFVYLKLKKKEEKKKTYKAGSRGSFTAGTGTKKKYNLLYRRQKRKKCDSQKGEEWVGKCLGLPCFLTLNVDNVKEGFLYSLRNISALSVIFKRTRKGLKHYFGSIENGAEVFEYGMVMKL